MVVLTEVTKKNMNDKPSEYKNEIRANFFWDKGRENVEERFTNYLIFHIKNKIGILKIEI